MVQGSFPGSALATQLFRQLTKPISQRIVRYAAQHPAFRKYGLIIPGRAYHRLDAYLSFLRYSNGKIDRTKIKPIGDEEAVEIGSQLMIEVVIFALLVVLLILDWIRSQRRSGRLEERRRKEFSELEEEKMNAQKRVLELERKIIEISEIRDKLEQEIQL